MVKHCTNCEAFAWWDGDFCCTIRMALIEGAQNGKFWAILPDAFDANKCDDYLYCDHSVYDYETQYINFIKEVLNDDNNYFSNDFILKKYGYKHYKKDENGNNIVE